MRTAAPWTLALLVTAAVSTPVGNILDSAMAVQLNIQLGMPDLPPAGFEAYTSPLVLPSPNITGDAVTCEAPKHDDSGMGYTPGCGWPEALVKAKAFVAQLTVPELVNLSTGTGVLNRCVGQTGTVPRLNFSGICLEDSPLGVRFGDYSSAFPAGINSASTWDRALIYARGMAMGREHRGKGVNVQLGPMMNLGRAAAAGRNWEGAGGDPWLAGVVSSETIKGIQSVGVMASAKHYVGNEQEHFRGGSGAQASSSNINDRTMHELYTWPFAESVRAGVASVMCSYQRVNQTFACENSKILNGILKEELDFQGFVVSDWGALESGVNSALAGADMDMPGFYAYGNASQGNPATSNDSYWGAAMVMAVNNGSVPLWRLQDMVTRTMTSYYRLGQDDPAYPKVSFSQLTEDTYLNGTLVNEHVDVQADHYKLIREIGGASTVMLKNNATLPLDASHWRRWGIFGSDAGPNINGPNACVDRGCDEGTLAMGWGSGSANFPYLVDPFAAMQAFIHSIRSSAVIEGMLNDYNYVQAKAIARQADICVVFANSDSGEGYITVDGNAGDRNNLTLWHSGDDLIKTVASECNNTIVVLHAVGPVILEAWVENPNITAILWAGLPGQESGNAIVDVLFGGVNPSGRLPYTIAKARSDYSADVLYNSTLAVPQITYSEELLIDYRWFDAQDITPRYEFGFGLSYTNFTYTEIDVAAVNHYRRATPGGPSILYDTAVTIGFTVQNTGGCDGHEVSQVYLGFPVSAGEPPKVLRGFERTFLKQGESAYVVVKLNRKEISVWDVVHQAWMIPYGDFAVFVGASSRDIRLQAQFSQ